MVRWYADRGPQRRRQILGDVLVVVLGYVIVTMALDLREAIASLGEVGTLLDRAGRTVSQGADRAADVIGGVPGIGGLLSSPFETISGAGGELSTAGNQIDDALATVALQVPLLLIGFVLGYVAFWYLPQRIRWIQEADEVHRLMREPDGDRLLAHRALATRPLRELRRRGGGSVGEDLAAGRWSRLAAIELEALGIDDRRLPAASPEPS